MKITYLFIVLVVIFSMLLSGCSSAEIAPKILNGDVVAVQARTAQWVIQSARDGVAGSSIYNFGNLYLFNAPIGSNIGFVPVDTAKTFSIVNVCNGNMSNCSTFEDLIKYLTAMGWKRVTVIPKVFSNGATLESLASMANTMFTPVIIPAVAPYSPIREGIKQ